MTDSRLLSLPGTSAFGAGPMEVAALAGSILLSNLPEAAGGAKEMRGDGRSRAKIFALWACTAMLLSLAAIAGNLLGAEQSGHIMAVGYDTYCRLLRNAVATAKGKPAEKEPGEIEVDLGSVAFLPAEYVPDERTRMALLRRLASAGKKKLMAIKIEMVPKTDILDITIKHAALAVGFIGVGIDTGDLQTFIVKEVVGGAARASHPQHENGGRASYIHYAEPIDGMVDASHLGYPPGKMHLTLLATEVLETTVGTGMSYLLDTTAYEEVNGNVRFMPELIHGWETPFAYDHHIPGGEEWLLFSPHNADTQVFQTGLPGLPDTSHGGAWDARIYLSSYHAGLWVMDVETLMLAGLSDGNKTVVHMDATIGYHLPHGVDGEPLDSSYYDFGWTPFLWAAEYHKGYTYLSCITTGLYIVQLDIDQPYGVPLGQ